MAKTPPGTYRCCACDSLWSEAEVIGADAFGFDQKLKSMRPLPLTCGDACCGCNVLMVSNLPKPDYLSSLQGSAIPTLAA